MKQTPLAIRLGRNDLRLIGRDQLLISMFVFALLLSLALRYGLPWLNEYLSQHGVMPGELVDRPLYSYYPPILAHMILYNGAALVGTVFGFLLLGEKDDRTWCAMLVTPVSPLSYLGYRVAATSAFGFLIVASMLAVTHQGRLGLWQLPVLAVGAALTAPIVALFITVTAENKVQGFAVAKFVSLAGGIIVLGWFVAEPWQWLFGLFPPFLVSKAYWMAWNDATDWWVTVCLAIVMQGIMTMWLSHRITRII
ncbi:hypothetical protein [uncultured Microbulbifer sp.]|uniref:hypothetical protein n=1 Tax=uncultured Microbulbifer sp. TaxID=348147 RepID=UPI0026158947|nr:hypothetical protein [uncultured Microbulbifer sp.]